MSHRPVRLGLFFPQAYWYNITRRFCPVRKCSEQDWAAINTYLDQNPTMDLFFIGNIENFGLDQEVWCDIDLACRNDLCRLRDEGKTDQLTVRQNAVIKR